MRKEKRQRFEISYEQAGFMDQYKILIDKQTGVNYLFTISAQAGGLTVLLDKEGKPVITPIEP
ncbi:DUF6440 family protein [Clostridium sp. DL1XJH146]